MPKKHDELPIADVTANLVDKTVVGLDMSQPTGSRDVRFNVSDILAVGSGGITNKYDATAAPTANDDSANTSGNGTFSVGSEWVDTANDETYRCVDSTPTAAIWVKTSSTGSGVLDNTTATAPPTATNDNTEGYSIGSRWFFGNEAWIAPDVSTGAAVWEKTTTEGEGLIPYDLQLGFAGVPSASQTDYIVAPRAFTISDGNHEAVALVAATAATDFDVQVNGVSIGTLSFAAAGTTATLTLAATQAVAAGQNVSIIAPVAPDATLANIRFALRGTL